MSERARADGKGRRPPRRRPAPRRKSGPGRAGRIQWDRVGRIAFVLVVGALMVSAVKPAYNLAKAYRLEASTKVRLQEAQAENARLERRVKHVESETVLRRQARRQGLIVPGEQAYVVNGIKDKP